MSPKVSVVPGPNGSELICVELEPVISTADVAPPRVSIALELNASKVVCVELKFIVFTIDVVPLDISVVVELTGSAVVCVRPVLELVKILLDPKMLLVVERVDIERACATRSLNAKMKLGCIGTLPNTTELFS